MPSSKQLFNLITQALSPIYDADEARSIAFLLMEHTLRINKTAILADKLIEDKQFSQTEAMVNRLKNQEPVQYVIGETEFMGRMFKVNRHVLIPRPETEELVDIIIRENKINTKLQILDIGTGSGCIAVSLAAFFPVATVWAMDISPQALQVAKSNAALNQVSVQFIQGDILDNEKNLLPTNSSLDIVVSNPPYVTHAEKPLMRKNVTDFEPHQALFVEDNDPLLFYRHIIAFCVRHLQKGGSCYFEINEQFAQAIADLFIAHGFMQTKIYKDISGKDRFVKGQL